MIGGHDLSVTIPVSTEDMDVLLRSARVTWPQAMVETGDGERLVSIGDALRLSWPIPSEVFIYKTLAAYESWTSSGLTDENADEMVAVTLEPDGLAFVVSGAEAPTKSLIDEMIEAVRKNQWLGQKAAA